jgi:hypothetical protein
MTQTAAIVTTLKNPGPSLDSFIKYHLEIGFAKLFLFFDDPADPSIGRARKYQDVVIIRNDSRLKRLWKKTNIAITNPYLYEFRKSETSLRQELNVEIAIKLALKRKVDWLLHIDSDELFYPFRGNVPEHFQSLSERGIENVIYANYEAIPETMDIEDYFGEVTLFKKNFCVSPKLSLNRQQSRATKGIPQLPDRLFHFYDDGKSAARLTNELLPDGVHRFKANQRARHSSEPRRRINPSICRNAAILHYPCCGFSNFWRKYKTLGSFSDKWFNQIDIAGSIGSFHLESRDVVRRNRKKEAREFYKRRVVIDKKSVIKLLIDSGVACRIKEPFTRLNRLR